MGSYMIVLMPGILCAMQFAFTKVYQNKEGSSFSVGLIFNFLVGVVTALFFFVFNKFSLEFKPYSLILAFIQSIGIIVYTVLGFKVMSDGNVGNYTFYLMTGGMVLPFIYGILFLNEEFKTLHIIGLLLLMIAILLINGSSKSSLKTKLYYIAIFVANGVTSIVAKMNQFSQYNTVSSTDFLIWCNLFKIILCFFALIFLTCGKFEFHIEKNNLLIIIVTALVSGFSYWLQLYAAISVPATILYPIVTGGTIVFSNIAGALFFKESVSKKAISGLILCVIGICLFV